MLEHLRGEDEIEALSVRRKAEDVRLPEGEPGMARSRLGDRRRPEIDAEIPLKRDAARDQAVEKKGFAAAEVEKALRRAGADGLRKLVVKGPEA